MPEFGVRSIRNAAPGDGYRITSTMEEDRPAHPLDGEEARKVHRRLLEWFYSKIEEQDNKQVREAMDRKRGTFASVEIDSIRFTDQRSAQFDFEKNVFVVDMSFSIRAKR
jgi:hypothetical protein